MSHILFKKIGAVFLAALLIFSLTSCSDESADAVIRVEIDAMPLTLDPQLASADSELLAVHNIYEGLFRLDENDNAVNAVCSDYTVSDDRLTYTFTLSDKAMWKNDTPVTADDFVYGIRRGISPVTKAPFAGTLSCIKNAAKVSAGEISETELGVTALDDHTLKIELEYENPALTEILASPIAMPCNEQFFESAAGRYGMTQKTIMSNGSFRVYQWQDKQIRLTNSSSYAGDHKAKCAAVLLNLTDSKAENLRIDRITNGDVDIGKVTDEELASSDLSKVQITSFENISYILAVNPQSGLGKGQLAYVWSKAFDRSKFSGSLPSGLTPADSLTPSALTIAGGNFESRSGLYDLSYDPQTAKSELLEAVSQLSGGKLPSIELLYPEVPGMKEVVTSIALDWQTELGAYVNIAADEASSIASKVKSGNYQIAVVPVSSSDNSVTGFFKNFLNTESGGMISGLDNSELSAAIGQLTSMQYSTSAVSHAQSCEEILSRIPNLIPLVFGHTHYAASSNIKSVNFTTSAGLCDLAYAVKKG